MARDPKRIKEIMSLLEKAWELAPDWRLCQLISNLHGTGPQDIFYTEDDVLKQLLGQVKVGPLGVEYQTIDFPIGVKQIVVTSDELAVMQQKLKDGGSKAVTNATHNLPLAISEINHAIGYLQGIMSMLSLTDTTTGNPVDVDVNDLSKPIERLKKAIKLLEEKE